jgi:hypothetical protein
MFKKLLTLISILSFTAVISQEHNEHHIILKPNQKDTVCLRDCLTKAHWEAHTRTFFMSTINEHELKDDYALASGAGIGLLTKSLFGFQVGVSGFFMYNIHSSAIDKSDVTTGQGNRYEIGLFDVENPHNKHDLDRLEELYLKYSLSKSSIIVGKINLNTPFLNPQDGRMRPTLEEGVWLSLKESKKMGINGGWIWDISPRSTVKWYSVSNSMGVYPMGVNTNGSKANYNGQIVGSTGIALANVYVNPNNSTKINLWNAFLENVMNTSMLEINHEHTIKQFKLYKGLILLHQHAINNGGNADATHSYMNKGEQSNVISSQIGIKNKKINTSLNYTHITGDGRYLMPREWGKEPFYTFLNRERNEGYGNLHAFMTKTSYTNANGKFTTTLAYGYYLLPDVKNYRLNKYGLPSYHQLNYYATYSFDNFFKGLEIKFLAAAKIKQGETYNNLKFVYNKVNMINFNLVFDFKI